MADTTVDQKAATSVDWLAEPKACKKVALMVESTVVLLADWMV